MDMAVERIRGTMAERETELDDAEALAEAVGIGALVFNELKNRRMVDTRFDLDAILSFEGDTGPYIQYAHVRLSSILRKAQGLPSPKARDGSCCANRRRKLSSRRSPSSATGRPGGGVREPSIVAQYALELAEKVHSFTHHHRVLDVDATPERLLLVEAARRTLAKALDPRGLGTSFAGCEDSRPASGDADGNRPPIDSESPGGGRGYRIDGGGIGFDDSGIWQSGGSARRFGGKQKSPSRSNPRRRRSLHYGGEGSQAFFGATFFAAFFGAAFLTTAFFGAASCLLRRAAFLATAFFGAAFFTTAFFGAAAFLTTTFLATAFLGAAFFIMAFSSMESLVVYSGAKSACSWDPATYLTTHRDRLEK
jgi:hypothetical protein